MRAGYQVPSLLLILLLCPLQLDVYLFLFSDTLLVTKPQRKVDKAKVIRPPLMLERLVCRPLRDPSKSVLGARFSGGRKKSLSSSLQQEGLGWGATKVLPLKQTFFSPFPLASFLAIHLTEFQCVSNALVVHCPGSAARVRWLERIQRAQVWESNQAWAGVPGAPRCEHRGRGSDGFRVASQRLDGVACTQLPHQPLGEPKRHGVLKVYIVP